MGCLMGTLKGLVAARQAGAESLTLEALKGRRMLLVSGSGTGSFRTPAHAPLHPFLHKVPWDTFLVTPLVYRGHDRGVMTCHYLPDVHPRAR